MPWMAVWFRFCSSSLPAFRSTMSSVLLALLATNRRWRLASMARWSRLPGLPLRAIVRTSSSSAAGAGADSNRAADAATAARHNDFMGVLLEDRARLSLDGPDNFHRPRHGLRRGGGRGAFVLAPLQHQVAGGDDHAREQHVGGQPADDHD